MATLTSDRHTSDHLHLRSVAERTPADFVFEDGILPAPPRNELKKGPWENEGPATTDQQQETAKEVGPLIRIPRDMPPRRKFDLLQQWEGVVSEVSDDAVWAEILDLTNPSNAAEVVEIPFAEFAVSDRPLLQPGSVFYWSIGYETSPGGTIRRISETRVRRTAVWSSRTVASLKARACEIYSQFGNGDNDSPTAQ